MRTLRYALAAVALVAGLAGRHSAQAQRPSGSCHHADDFTDSLVARSRYALSLKAMSYMFEGSGLLIDDQRRIYPMQVDSLCQIAARTISRDLQVPDTTSRSIYLVKVGKLFWAVDRNVKGGVFYMVYIVDSTLTRILFKTMG